MAYDFEYWFEELVKIKQEQGDANFSNDLFVRKERTRRQKLPFTFMINDISDLKKSK